MISQKKIKEKYFYFGGYLHSRKTGERVGYHPIGNYSQIWTHGKLYYAHRLIYLYHYGETPDLIDHIDRDKTNNKIENLRASNKTTNACNAKIGVDNTSGVKGVSWNKRRSLWRAYITWQKKRIELGHYSCLALAKMVVQDARSKYHGEFAN